jgi:glycosyltransferase involved in cell wall biosynthesis
MRILIFNEYQPSSDRGEITGGVEAYCHYVGRRLGEQHEVRIVARTTNGSVWEAATIASIPARLWLLLRQLAVGLRSDFDVVMGTTAVVHPMAWLVGRLRRRPVVFWFADVFIGNWRSGQFGRLAGWVGEFSERLNLRLHVSRVIAISQATADKLVAQGVPGERIVVVPCGYDPAAVAAVEPESTDRRRVTVVGRLVPYKRVDLVVRAVARLQADVPDLELVVIGQGPELDGLRKLASELGIAHMVDFRGFVDRHTSVLAAIAGSRALASASEIEGFGIAVVEAMALGVPFAVSDIPAFREVTGGGVGGALFPPGDDVALADALRPALAAGPERDALVRAGRDRAAAFTWDAVAIETADILADLVEDANGKETKRGQRANS